MPSTTVAVEVMTEFQAAWSPREAELERDLQRAASAQAAEGRGRSGALLEDYAQIFTRYLGLAKSLILERVGVLASRHKRLGSSDLKSIVEAGAGQISGLGSSFNQRLVAFATGMGLAALAPTVTVDLLNSTLAADVQHAFKAAATQVSKPFSQGFVGGVLVAVVAGLILLLASKACGS